MAKFAGYAADNEGESQYAPPPASRATVAELTPELAHQIAAALAENAEEATGAIGRAFEGDYVLKAGEAAPRGDAKPSGPGIAFAFKFGDEAMLVLMTAGGGLVPEWTRAPDATGESKLSTLSQELSMLLVPDSLMADSFEAAWVEDLGAAVERSEAAAEATRLPIEVAKGEDLGELSMIWPVASPDAALKDGSSTTAPAAADRTSEPAPTDDAEPPSQPEPGAEDEKSQSTVLRWNRPLRDFRDLPPNTRSALQVQVAFSVNLAGKKMKLKDIIELGPGSIVTFDKGCDDVLEVTVGDRPVATGEAVKVGERFGVRVKDMILPEEHFRPMLPPSTKAS